MLRTFVVGMIAAVFLVYACSSKPEKKEEITPSPIPAAEPQPSEPPTDANGQVTSTDLGIPVAVGSAQPTPSAEPTPTPAEQPSPVPTPQPSAATITMYVTSGGLNVRSEPSMQGQVVRVLPRGAQVEITGKEGIWGRLGQAEEYVSVTFLSQNPP